MKIAIANKGDGNIITVKEYDPIESKGELAHFIAEIGIINLELLELWEEFNSKDEGVMIENEN